MQHSEHAGEHHAQPLGRGVLPPERPTTDSRSSPPGASDMERRIAALAAQVVRLGADLDGEVPSSPAPPPEGSALKNAIIASAEAAAAGIRASAEREARRIRGRAAGPASERVSRFVTMIARQREMLATLVLEADRVGHATARLNALTQALDAELQTLLRSVRSGER